MSRNNNIKNVKTPYCKVCHDAGKPESVYTNHWVKSIPDKNGKSSIICPTLLDTECRYCFKLGHTTKFCPVLEQQNKKKEKEDRRTKAVAKEEKSVKSNIPSKPSAFAVLDLGSDSEEEEEVNKVSNIKVREEFPSIVKVKIPSVELTGWAAIAAKPKEEKPTVFGCPIQLPKLVRQTAIDYTADTDTPVVVKSAAPWSKKDVVVKKSWADYSDSESEGEEWKTYEEDETW